MNRFNSPHPGLMDGAALGTADAAGQLVPLHPPGPIAAEWTLCQNF
ncbi:hypothetical protein [Streptomyces sp. NBC_01264]|nr:hypothetical protein [Streptomyces sp. NBC_01264]MCX4781670.1 hypothetical protein [Streptomyces sp. NBC_01264]